MPGSELADLFYKRCITEEPCVPLFHMIPLSPIPPFFQNPPPPHYMWPCPFLIRMTDRRSEEKDKKNERGELRCCHCGVCGDENTPSLWEHPQTSFLQLQTFTPPPPSSPIFIFDEWSDKSLRVKTAVMTELFPRYFKLTCILKYNYWTTWNHNMYFFFLCTSVLQLHPVRLTHWFPLERGSATQMAWVCVITVDNGCGSPLTSATTGSVDTQSHTLHVAMLTLLQPAEAGQDYNSWTGRWTTNRGVILYVHGAPDDSLQRWREGMKW